MKSQILGDQLPTCQENAEPRKARDFWLEPLFEGTLAIFVGLFVLWLYLTVVGFIRLHGAATPLLQSTGLTIGIASWMALTICGVGLPLMLPWFLAFLASEFFLPKDTIFWKWWVRTPLGMAAGVFALWIDALVYSLLASGTSLAVNVSLLRTASVPAAIMAGATCFSAAAGAKCFKAPALP